jgi:hypothetical protein
MGMQEIVHVETSIDGGQSWINACVAHRKEYEWQIFKQNVVFDVAGHYTITARATDSSGVQQPLRDRRNQVSTMKIQCQR